MNHRIAIWYLFVFISLFVITSCIEQETQNADHTIQTVKTDENVKNIPSNAYNSAEQNIGDDNKDHRQDGIHMNEPSDLTNDEINELSIKANSGDGEAAQSLFVYYSLVVGDIDKEMHWMRKAAENGHPTAQYNLGITIRDHPEYGNREQSLYWLSKAADSGYRNARIELGRRFSDDELKSLLREGEEGNANSALTLYSYYKKVEKDDKRAKYWFKRWQDIMHNQN